MLNQTELECLRACNDCATACLQCASACLQEDEPKTMVPCIELDIDCAGICKLAAASIASAGRSRNAICALCVEACTNCEAECKKHSMDHCQECAQTCRRCAEACRAMAS